MKMSKQKIQRIIDSFPEKYEQAYLGVHISVNEYKILEGGFNAMSMDDK